MEFTESFRAMNTDIDAIIDAPSRPLDAFLTLRLLFEQQEERFSRFRPSSFLSRLNAGEVIDDRLFAAGCRLALEAYSFTGGVFNPMVLNALTAAGYGTSFERVHGGQPQEQSVPDPGTALVIEGTSVRLIDGALDLGGIVKGWTVDLGIEALRGTYPNLCINAGGDLRCEGAEAGVDGWEMAIAGSEDDEEVIWQGPMRGALATSTTQRRRWVTDSGSEAHHLIDPRTGLPAVSPFVQVSAWATETWRAECWAKAVLIGGEPAKGRAERAGVRVLAVAGIR
ncbi:MAG: FAD:protein FMN transferase [Tepidiformaceae bacterium]